MQLYIWFVTLFHRGGRNHTGNFQILYRIRPNMAPSQGHVGGYCLQMNCLSRTKFKHFIKLVGKIWDATKVEFCHSLSHKGLRRDKRPNQNPWRKNELAHWFFPKKMSRNDDACWQHDGASLESPNQLVENKRRSQPQCTVELARLLTERNITEGVKVDDETIVVFHRR